MSEIAVPIISGVIGSISGALGAYIIFKKTLNIDTLMPIFEDFTDELMKNKDIQEKLFIVGGIIGKGIGGGLGLAPRSKGKFKPGDLVGILAEAFLPGFIAKMGGQPAQQTAPENNQNNEILGGLITR